MSTGSFCSRSNCTATFKRSAWCGVAEGGGLGIDVCAGAEPRRVSNITIIAMPHTNQGCCLMTALPLLMDRWITSAPDAAIAARPVCVQPHSSCAAMGGLPEAASVIWTGTQPTLGATECPNQLRGHFPHKHLGGCRHIPGRIGFGDEWLEGWRG